MFLQHKRSGHMIDVLQPQQLFDLYQAQVLGVDQVGEEAQDAELFKKQDLCFLSGEALPECWLDPNYRQQQKSLLQRALHL